MQQRLGFWDFFHDLGRIHASLFRLPRCRKVTYLGLVVLVLSLTSARIARRSLQVWLARSTCFLASSRSQTGSFGQANLS